MVDIGGREVVAHFEGRRGSVPRSVWRREVRVSREETRIVSARPCVIALSSLAAYGERKVVATTTRSCRANLWDIYAAV